VIAVHRGSGEPDPTAVSTGGGGCGRENRCSGPFLAAPFTTGITQARDSVSPEDFESTGGTATSPAAEVPICDILSLTNQLYGRTPSEVNEIETTGSSELFFYPPTGKFWDPAIRFCRSSEAAAERLRSFQNLGSAGSAA
jgi:hypothetical protein